MENQRKIILTIAENEYGNWQVAGFLMESDMTIGGTGLFAPDIIGYKTVAEAIERGCQILQEIIRDKLIVP